MGTQDSFFDLGGHALLLIQLHARLGAGLHGEVGLIDLFTYPTIQALAEYLTQTQGEAPDAARNEACAITHRRDREAAAGALVAVGVVGEEDAVMIDAKLLDQGIAIIGIAGRFPLSQNRDRGSG